MNQYEFNQPPVQPAILFYLMNKQSIQLNQISSELIQEYTKSNIIHLITSVGFLICLQMTYSHIHNKSCYYASTLSILTIGDYNSPV